MLPIKAYGNYSSIWCWRVLFIVIVKRNEDKQKPLSKLTSSERLVKNIWRNSYKVYPAMGLFCCEFRNKKSIDSRLLSMA